MQETKYAIIFENEVKNIMICYEYDMANTLARACFGDKAFALDVTNLILTHGDKYEDGIFYHKIEDGTYIIAERIPSSEDKINELTELIMTLYREMEAK